LRAGPRHAPDSARRGGGQQEVLAHRPNQLFESVPEAVRRISDAVERDATPSLPPDRFGRDRFQAAIRDHVVRALEAREGRP
jgi:hypothetical protein